TAADLHAAAFAVNPKLAKEYDHRYDAACYAVLAAAGQGTDAAGLDDKERSRLRQQALAWLQADLDDWRGLLDKQPATIRIVVIQKMKRWQRDPDFDSVRGAAALSQLPQAERQPWQQLWADVAATLAQAQGQGTPTRWRRRWRTTMPQQLLHLL